MLARKKIFQSPRVEFITVTLLPSWNHLIEKLNRKV